MRKKYTILFLLLSLFLGANTLIFALPQEQEHAIQSFIDEARRISRATGISVAVVIEDEVYFFSSGLAHRIDEIFASEETLWELASVSKAFTALGVLYLEEQGFLSLNDSIADHLPWLTFRYNGQLINMQEVRLYHLLHHTSGLPLATESAQGTLKSGVEALIDAELAFFPGEHFSYGNGNFNILGLIIETVSRQSYDSFMEERIFRPLGMTQTFANQDHAKATGRLAQGYATQFIFFPVSRDAPEAEIRENIPTGYIISSAKDMARWMKIQLGLVADMPEVFRAIVPKSHGQEQWVAEWESYYAAGWLVSADGLRIEHGGNNPSFTTFALLHPEEQIGITVLVNSCQTIDTALIANSIVGILNGDFVVRYSMSAMQIMDMIFTIITILSLAFVIVFFIHGQRRRKQSEGHPLTKNRIILITLWSLITLALVVVLLILPSLMLSGSRSWSDVLTWVSLSFLTMPLALVSLSASITWFVAFPRHTVSA